MGIRLVWTILYNYLQRTTNYANCTKTEETEWTMLLMFSDRMT